MTRVAILWHMHQPFYQDLFTGEHILPWVRLHALKDYWGMVALMREFPEVRVTFNLVPSLLVQLEAYAAGEARDRHLELGLKPADELSESDVDFVLEHFFHAHRERMIDPYPRYAELLALRGGTLPTAGDRRAVATRFSRDDLRDLQVWHKLVWLDPEYLAHDPRVRRLLDRGRGFEESDKECLRDVELELLNRVIPEYRAAADRGQVELSTSPFYHPILPLLCDTDVYLRTHPDSPMPRQRFSHPEDASEQLVRAASYHERLFGRRPVGLWPSEGSVSDQMVPLVAAAGFRWMATDELILAQTLGEPFTRDAFGALDHPERLYKPYALEPGGAGLHPEHTGVAVAFRDHVLSDLIGFTYAGWAPEAAADDFSGRLVEAGRRYAAGTGGREAFIPIILDGENAWEHFEAGGRPFLRALYRRLSEHPEIRTVTMAEGCREPADRLGSIFPGSWIDGNFYIWIGHADDRRAWGQIVEARQAFMKASTEVDAAARSRAFEEILIAEGSDWCWWYGDDHSSAHDLEFDDLFRRHLRNVYRLIGMPVPDELFQTNISSPNAAALRQTDPVGYVHPTLDGEETSYFEWLPAGSVEISRTFGAMHQARSLPANVSHLWFGFDRERFYLRLDAELGVRELLATGHEISVKCLRPPCDLNFKETGHSLTPGAQAAIGTILELAVPFADLGLSAGGVLTFFVTVKDRAGTELERHPEYRPVEITIPDAGFESRHWTA